MPNRISILITGIAGLLLLAQAGPARSLPDICGNPLTVNGQPFNYDTFPVNSWGVLALVEGDPASKHAKPMPFRVYLRRAGTVVRRGASDETREVYSVQLAEVLSAARLGDELVVEPAGPSANPRAKRVIRLTWFNYLTLKNGDGC